MHLARKCRDKLLNAGGAVIFAAASIIYARGSQAHAIAGEREFFEPGGRKRAQSEVLVIAKPTSQAARSRRFALLGQI